MCWRRWSFCRRRAAICTTAADRDENVVSWEAQDDLASRGIGSPDGPLTSAEWMRLYFRNAKATYRNVTQLLEQAPPLAVVAGALFPALAFARFQR